MVKITPGDLKAILRLFHIDGSDNSDRHIDAIKSVTPSKVSQAVFFRFNKKRYCVLYDETADDDIAYLQTLIDIVSDTNEGSLVKNPTESFLTFGVPFKGKTVYLYLAQPEKKRLDSYMAEKYPKHSRSTWQKHIKAGRVRVNGNVVLSAKHEVYENDNVTVDLPEEADHSKKTLPVMYEDENVIVINKPAGILTHSKGAMNDEFTVADFFRRFTAVGLDTNRPGIVHRLDRDTSGVLIGAKSEAAARLLARQFSERKTKKTYVAVLAGHLRQKEAVIELPLGRNPSAPSTFRVDARGKMAVTRYKVLAENQDESLVELRPVTGRTHQLRVHMAYVGAPIKGDRVYGHSDDRLYLHAHELEITIPPGDRRVFKAPLPHTFTDGFKGKV